MRYTLLQVIFVLVVALFVYYLFSPYFHYFEHETHEQGEHEGETKENEVYHELMGLLDKSKEFYSQDGVYVHKEYLGMDGKYVNSILKMVKNKGDFNVELSREFLYWNATKKGDKEEICFSFLGNESCSNITESLNGSFRSLENSIVSEEWVDRVFIKKYKVLYDAHAFSSLEVEDANYTLGSCKEFIMNYSYKKLSVEELNEIGISPSSVLATSVDSISEKVCIDEEGRILYKEFYYSLSLPHNETFELIEYREEPEEITLKPTSSPSILENLVRKASAFYANLRKCTSSGDDMCFRQIAISSSLPSICERAVKKKECFEAYAAFNKNPNVCDYLEEYNITLPDYCNESYEMNNTINVSNNDSMEG